MTIRQLSGRLTRPKPYLVAFKALPDRVYYDYQIHKKTSRLGYLLHYSSYFSNSRLSNNRRTDETYLTVKTAIFSAEVN